MAPAPRVLVAVLVLAAVARLGAFVTLHRFTTPEVWESETIATNLLEGRGFTYPTLGQTYRSYMEPLYPALCAAVYRFTNHSFLALGLVQVALGVALVWLVFACARRIAAEEAAILAAALAAVHPGLVLYTTKFHPFVLDSALWFGVFAAVLAFRADRPWRSAIFAGALLGACVLTRPTILACLPAMAWWIWRRAPATRRAKLLVGATFVVSAAIVASPWVWRNYRVHHRLMLTRSGTSFVFWLGNNPYLFTGSAMTRDGVPVIDRVPEAVRRELGRRDELGQQDYFQEEAARFVRERPLEFARRWMIKFWYFWWFSPQAGLLYPRASLRVFQLFYVAIVSLAASALWTSWKETRGDPARRDAIIVIAACCLSIATLQSAYYVEGRHRLAIEPFLLIFAGVSLWRMSRAWRPA